jgi:chorismate synthase
MTSGESHGPALLAILDGMPAGLPIDAQAVNEELARRQQGYGAGPRMKLEQDTAQILGGVMSGLTTGAPLGFQIENRDHAKWRGKPIPAFTTPRPGHADLSGAIKYGYRDLRPALERASARETAARVAVGAACKLLLAQFGIQVGGYVVAIGEGGLDKFEDGFKETGGFEFGKARTRLEGTYDVVFGERHGR